MTEIPIFPAGAPPEPVATPDPGDWHGLFSSLHLSLGRIASNLPDPRRSRLEKNLKVWPVRVDPVPVPLNNGAGILDMPNLLSPGMGYNWDVHSISASGYTAGLVTGWINLPTIAAGALQGAPRFAPPITTTTTTSTPAVNTPTVPGSTVTIQNTNAFGVSVVITGGTMSAVVVNGLTVGTGAGTYVIPAFGSISLTYTVAPTWVWSAASASTVTTSAGLGVQFYGKGHLWLRGQGERLVFVASGITGNLLVSMDATSVADDFVGEYFA